MKKFLLILSLCFGFIMANAQLNREWTLTDPTSGFGIRNNGIAVDAAGNIYSAGGVRINDVANLKVQKVDAQGNIIWTQTYLPAGAQSSSSYAVALDAAGNVVVSGALNPGPTGLLIKYDTNGNLLWATNLSFVAISLSVDESDNIYVSSWTFSTSMKTCSYNPDGTLRWSTNLTVPQGQMYRTVYKNGAVYVTGSCYEHPAGTPPNLRIYVVSLTKLNSTTGSLTWARSYYHSDKIAQTGYDLVVDGSGNVYVAGDVYNKSGGNQNLNMVVVKYNSSGTLQWAKVYDGAGKDYYEPGPAIFHGFDSFADIDLDNGGNVLLTGSIFTSTGQDLGLIKINAAGAQLWEKSFDGNAHIEDRGMVITTDASANVYVAGSMNTDNTKSDAIILKYNSSGTLQASDSYDDGLLVKDQFTNLKADASGNIYVAGSSQPNSLLIKYSASLPQQLPILVTENLSLKLYPVPAKDMLTIENAEGAVLGHFNVTDMNGKLIYKNFTSASIFKMDISRFANGIYFINIGQDKKIVKFIKQ